MVDLFDELRTIVSVLDESGVEHAICGGLALTIHGFPRATFDIDVLIREEALDNALEAVRQYGYDLRGLDMSFNEQTIEIRRVSKIEDDGDVLSLDFLLVTPTVEDVWQSKITLEWEGRPITVVSKEGLITMKRQSGRHKDLIDIDRIENEES